MFKNTHLCLIVNLPLLQDTTMFLPLVVKLGLEQSVLIPQLVVLRPVLLCFLWGKKGTQIRFTVTV